MSIIKCKSCGGDLEILPGSSVARCEYCNSQQTIPSGNDEKKLTLFARANRLRAAYEFDKAAGLYEAIVGEFSEEAEAYWGLVLCKYGIEYVDDPATGKKIPTCHRSSFGAFGCPKLKKLIIPSTVKWIDSDAFDYSYSGTCSNVSFYCRAESMPSGWEAGWNLGRPVVWGYTGN